MPYSPGYDEARRRQGPAVSDASRHSLIPCPALSNRVSSRRRKEAALAETRIARLCAAPLQRNDTLATGATFRGHCPLEGPAYDIIKVV